MKWKSSTKENSKSEKTAFEINIIGQIYQPNGEEER